jgi:hypothetical protein
MSWCEIAVAIADFGLRISFPEDIRPDNPPLDFARGDPQSAINRALQIGVTRRGGPK